MQAHTFSLRERLNSLGVPVKRLVTDSRAVQAGDTFVAYPGEKTDGRKFIVQAIAQGASAIIFEDKDFEWNDEWDLPHLGMASLRDWAGSLADEVYGAPSRKLWMVGITGTNGKTSTSHWIAHAFNEAQQPCALIGTLGNGFIGALQASANTTPDAIRVHALLSEYLDQGAQAVAMEVSSHALAQGRVNSVNFDVALLTNLSRDHLDYHGNMQHYADSKRKLFCWDQLKFAILNLDDEFGVALAEQLQNESVEVVAYGLGDAARACAERMGIRMVCDHLTEMNGHGMSLDIHSSWGNGQLNSTLIGRFNGANLLGALAVLLVSEVSLSAAVLSLGKVRAVSGRMQRVGTTQQPAVVVDYAHTPDALEKVLLALREVDTSGQGKLICVFGCGGDRDRGKRAMMGKVAEKFSDHCVVTSDNPRSEDPQRIIAEVVAGMTAGNHEIIVDRAAAITHAIGLAHQHDTVLVAGKGHEDYQEVNGVKLAFSDVLVAQHALQNWHPEARA